MLSEKQTVAESLFEYTSIFTVVCRSTNCLSEDNLTFFKSEFKAAKCVSRSKHTGTQAKHKNVTREKKKNTDGCVVAHITPAPLSGKKQRYTKGRVHKHGCTGWTAVSTLCSVSVSREGKRSPHIGHM